MLALPGPPNTPDNPMKSTLLARTVRAGDLLIRNGVFELRPHRARTPN